MCFQFKLICFIIVNEFEGEAEFTQDIPIRKDTLFGALALAPHGPGTIDSLDASAALVRNVIYLIESKTLISKYLYVMVVIKRPIFVVGRILMRKCLF